MPRRTGGSGGARHHHRDGDRGREGDRAGEPAARRAGQPLVREHPEQLLDRRPHGAHLDHSTTWSFGDGASATGNGVKGADVGAPDALEHSYTRQGSYDISTTTSYDLTFVLPGGGAQTVQLVSPPSPPVTLPVSEIQTRVSYVR